MFFFFFSFPFTKDSLLSDTLSRITKGFVVVSGFAAQSREYLQPYCLLSTKTFVITFHYPAQQATSNLLLYIYTLENSILFYSSTRHMKKKIKIKGASDREQKGNHEVRGQSGCS